MEYLLKNLEGEAAYYAQAAVEEIAKLTGTTPVKLEKRTSHTFVIDGAEFAEGTAFKFDWHYYQIGPLIVLKKMAYFLTRSYIDPRIILKAIEARENNHPTISKQRWESSDPNKPLPFGGFPETDTKAVEELTEKVEELSAEISRVTERNPGLESDIKAVTESLKEYEAGKGGLVGKPEGASPAIVHPESIISKEAVERHNKKKGGLFGLTFGKKDKSDG